MPRTVGPVHPEGVRDPCRAARSSDRSLVTASVADFPSSTGNVSFPTVNDSTVKGTSNTCPTRKTSILSAGTLGFALPFNDDAQLGETACFVNQPRRAPPSQEGPLAKL